MKTRRQLHTATLALLIGMLGARASQAATSEPPPPSDGYSAALLYDEGNADARQGDIGRAVLAYERARLLTPQDPDLQANLHYVRSTSGLPPADGSWLERFAGFASANSFFWLGCAGLCIAGASTLLRRRHPRLRRLLSATTGIGLSLMLATLCDAAAVRPRMNEAVVIAAGAPARVAPASVAESVATLLPGQTVCIEAESGNFVLVHTQAGSTGWVARADLARVVPLPS